MVPRKLTDEETVTLKKKAREILSVCRRDLLSKFPFLGNVALRMDIIPVRDIRVRTACTDGSNVYFDIAFLSSLSKEERIFVFAHEVYHAVMMHMIRRHNRDPQLFNIATDKEINNMLKSDGFTPPENICFPTDDEKGKCAEEIYEMLLKQMKKMKSQKGKSGQQGQSGGSGSSGGSSGSKGKKQQQQNGSSEDGNKTGKLEGQFDKHIYGDESDSSQNGPDGANGQSQGESDPGSSGSGAYSGYSDKYGAIGFDKDFRPTVSKNFADKMRETIIAEAQRTARMRGTVPEAVKAFIDKITEPEVKWQEVLAQFVTRCYKSDRRSWIPPNRRHVYNDIYIQSRQGSKIKLAVGIDTSGSTCMDRQKFLGELNSLVKSFGAFDLTIIECDADIGDVKHYTQDDDLDNIIENGEYAMTGGGGTVLMPIFDYINENQLDVDAVVVMTDGYIDNIPKNPTRLPTLWVISKNGTEEFCDWGQKIHLTKDDDDE